LKSVKFTNGNKKFAFCEKDGCTKLKNEEEWNNSVNWFCGNWTCGYNSNSFLEFLEMKKMTINKKVLKRINI